MVRVVCLLAFMSGCGTTMSLITDVTRIEIKDNQNRLLAKIDDPGQVAKVVAFANARKEGWHVPLAGANFFECQRDGGFFSQRAPEAELREFETLVGAKRKF